MSSAKIHTAHNYLLNPMHPITVSLIGVGGTGSKMLTNLAMMDQALRGLGHPGLHVCAFDDDLVTQSNIGRQSYSPADVNLPKAAVLINRINRYYGLSWTYKLEKISNFIDGNIIITCVDNKAARRFVEGFQQDEVEEDAHQEQTLYWLDCGNGKDYGQVILSTRFEDNDKGTEPGNTLRSPSEIVPGAFAGRDDNKPSCSMAEALRQQDLFINTTIALYGSHLLYNLITKGSIDNQGVFINMKTLQNTKIKIQESKKQVQHYEEA